MFERGKRFKHRFEVRNAPNGQYVRWNFERWTLVAQVLPFRTQSGIKTTSGYLKVALIPHHVESLLLSEFFKTPPLHSRLTSFLRQTRTTFSELNHLSGWIRFDLLTQTLFAQAPPSLQRTAQAFGLPFTLKGSWNECSKEVVDLGQKIPRLLLGTHSEKEALWMDTLLELNSELYQQWSTLILKTSMPSSLTLPFQLNVAFSGKNLSTLLMKKAAQWQASPWKCPLFNDFNQVSSFVYSPQWTQYSLFMSSFSGLYLYIKSLGSSSTDISSSKLKGWIGMHLESAKLYLSILQQLPQAPQWLRTLTLTDDGNAKPLLTPPPSWETPFFSLSPKGVFLSSGSEYQTHHPLYHHTLNQIRSPMEVKLSKKAENTGQVLPFLALAFDPQMALEFRTKWKTLTQQNTKKSNKKDSDQNPSPSNIDQIHLGLTSKGILMKTRLHRP